MQLIPIPRDGNVSLPGVTIPEVALSVIAPTTQMYERGGYVEPWVGFIAVEEGNCVALLHLRRGALPRLPISPFLVSRSVVSQRV